MKRQLSKLKQTVEQFLSHFEAATKNRAGHLYLSIFLVLFFLVVAIRNAWLCEDSYIIFRTVDNFINGYGLRWNAAERVQSYTSPLWMFVLTTLYFITDEIYYSVIFFSLAVSFLVVFLTVSRIAKSTWSKVLVATALVFSKAFVDFSTSGLENPLGHLLLVVFLLRYFSALEDPDRIDAKQVFYLSLVAALGTITRLDYGVIFFPPLAFVAFKSQLKFRSLLWIGAGFAPFVFWEIFSIIYYGFPFPNTAYAKLNTGVSASLLAEQGLYYLRSTLNWDPLTVFVLLCALVASFLSLKKEKMFIFLSLGIILHLLFIIKVGGDFMSGRFMTMIYLCSTAILARAFRDSKIPLAGLSVMAVMLGLATAQSPLISNASKKNKEHDRAGVADERGRYYDGFGLFRTARNRYFDRTTWAAKGIKERQLGEHVVQYGMIGVYGYYAGPKVHIVDHLALADPLLARLPAMLPGKWRIGHFKREVPKGYLESTGDEDNIEDPHLKEYWKKLKEITRGRIFSLNRFKTIWKMNTGQLDYLVEKYCIRNCFLANYNKLSIVKKPTGYVWDKKSHIMSSYGVGVMLKKSMRGEKPKEFEASLRGGETYDVVYYNGQEEIVRQRIEPPEASGRQVVHGVTIPKEARKNKYDQIRFKPAGKWGRYSLGYFRLLLKPDLRTFDQMKKAGADDKAKRGDYKFKGRVLDVQLNGVRHSKRISVRADHDDVYEVDLFKGNKKMGQLIVPDTNKKKGMFERSVAVPHQMARAGYDRLRFSPILGDRNCVIAHFDLHDPIPAQ